VIDAVLVLLALLAAVRLVDATIPEFALTAHFEIWIAGTWVLWLFSLRVGGAYDLLDPEIGRGHPGSLARAMALVLVVTLIVYFFAPRTFPRSVTLVAPLLVLFLLMAWRRVASVLLLRWGRIERRILILGIDEATTRLASVLLSPHRSVPYVPVAFLTEDANAPATIRSLPVIIGVDDLWAHVARLGVAEIVVARSAAASKACQQKLIECYQAGITTSDVAQLYEHLTGRVLIGHVGESWYSELPTLPRRLYVTLKHSIDFVIAAVLLPILLPLLAVLAVLVVVDDGRPVLFRQVRLGSRGLPFVVHKLRTLRRDAELNGPQYAARNDPRSTKLGRRLRVYGLDELPQIWDILRGRMSVVGPRPERPEFVQQLAGELPLYRARLLLRPGVVGWAEVHVPHAQTLADHLVRLEYDLYYIKHAGVLLDINVVLRAIGLVLSGRRG
jgi:exopolysaccharide biosynthesis polyprenyl glycosylphosphotransferase